MRTASTLFKLAGAGVIAAALAACGSSPQRVAEAYPVGPVNPSVANSPVPSTSASVGTASSVSLEYGRVTSIDYVPASTATMGAAPAPARGGPNVLGAVVGGVAGAVLGNQVGGGRGRDAATVIGGVAGAAAGSQYGRGAATSGTAASTTTTTTPSYRVTVQTDQGGLRVYDVPATGELRVGDRVRVENGVIYRT